MQNIFKKSITTCCYVTILPVGIDLPRRNVDVPRLDPSGTLMVCCSLVFRPRCHTRCRLSTFFDGPAFSWSCSNRDAREMGGYRSFFGFLYDPNSLKARRYKAVRGVLEYTARSNDSRVLQRIINDLSFWINFISLPIVVHRLYRKFNRRLLRHIQFDFFNTFSRMKSIILFMFLLCTENALHDILRCTERHRILNIAKHYAIIIFWRSRILKYR